MNPSDRIKRIDGVVKYYTVSPRGVFVGCGADEHGWLRSFGYVFV